MTGMNDYRTWQHPPNQQYTKELELEHYKLHADIKFSISNQYSQAVVAKLFQQFQMV